MAKRWRCLICGYIHVGEEPPYVCPVCQAPRKMFVPIDADAKPKYSQEKTMKIYTGTGDGGKTSLFSGERIAKDDARIEAYGAVDELNAVVGALLAALPEGPQRAEIERQLTRVQSDLFHVGAWLATTPGSPSAGHLPPLTPEPGERLEKEIDAMQAQLPELNAFILPGGHPAAAWAHMARTVCRRAERRAVVLAAGSASTENLLVYLNRLSDYFFVLARYCNRLAGVEDALWRR
jgi:cob(I)alamin adenosyltransferase